MLVHGLYFFQQLSTCEWTLGTETEDWCDHKSWTHWSWSCRCTRYKVSACRFSRSIVVCGGHSTDVCCSEYEKHTSYMLKLAQVCSLLSNQWLTLVMAALICPHWVFWKCGQWKTAPLLPLKRPRWAVEPPSSSSSGSVNIHSVLLKLHYITITVLLPWVQPSGGSCCQVKLHPEASIRPGPAVVGRAAVSRGVQEIPSAGPMRSKAKQEQEHIKDEEGKGVSGISSSRQTLKSKQHLLSRWASPVWGREPRSRTPHSTEVI